MLFFFFFFNLRGRPFSGRSPGDSGDLHPAAARILASRLAGVVQRAAGVGRAASEPRPRLCDVSAGTWNPGSARRGEARRGRLAAAAAAGAGLRWPLGARGAAMSESSASALASGGPSRQPLVHPGRAATAALGARGTWRGPSPLPTSRAGGSGGSGSFLLFPALPPPTHPHPVQTAHALSKEPEDGSPDRGGFAFQLVAGSGILG